MSQVNESDQPNVPAVQPTESPGKIRLLALLLVLAALVSYLNSLSAPFIFDDQSWITEYRRIEHLPDDLKKLSVADRPLMHLSVALNYALGQLDVRGYHVFNLGVHILAGLLLYGIVHQTIGLCNRRSGRESARRQPWICGRPPVARSSPADGKRDLRDPTLRVDDGHVFSAVPILRDPGFASRARRAVVRRERRRLPVGPGLQGGHGDAPPVVLLYDRVFLSGSWRELLQRRGWVHALLFGSALGLVGFMLPVVLGGTEGVGGFGYQPVSPLAYLRSQPGVILHYLQLVFWPRPLCLDYLWPPATSAAQIYPPAAAILTLLLASLIAFRYRPWLGFLGLSFFLVLAPTSSIMPIADLAFEHRMYLPLAAIWCGRGLGDLRRDAAGAERPAAAAGSLGTLTFAATVLAALTCERNADYCDPVRIWTKVLMSARRIGVHTTHWQRPTGNAGTRPGSVIITSRRLPQSRTTRDCACQWPPACTVRAIRRVRCSTTGEPWS